MRSDEFSLHIRYRAPARGMRTIREAAADAGIPLDNSNDKE